MMDQHLYIVQRRKAQKYLVVLRGYRPAFPGIGQFFQSIVCLIGGHDWSKWQTEDMEGPGEQLDPDDPDSFMPFCTRESKPGEFGVRVCPLCGVTETRYPVEDLDPDTIWPRGDLVPMEV